VNDPAPPAPRSPRPDNPRPRHIVLTGNPNSGKTTVFNALTGLRAKVGNYAGVTVERKEGQLLNTPPGAPYVVLDLPGTYSLSPQSLDEQISRDVLLNRLPEVPAPALVVIVVDASNLQRNLYYATQVIELGWPVVVALNMMDVAEEQGHHVGAAMLSELLGVSTIPIVASKGQNIDGLRNQIIATAERGEGPVKSARQFPALPPLFAAERDTLARLLENKFPNQRAQARAEALLILSNEKALVSSARHYPPEIEAAVGQARARLEQGGIDWRSSAIEARYASIAAIEQAAVRIDPGNKEMFSDKLDRVLTHKIWGSLIFVALMGLMFQSIFTFARIPMDALMAIVAWAQKMASHSMPPGDLNSLISDGIIAGVGAVIVFLPQILLLFLFIGFLEDTGYMARAAFLMDRVMSKVGLHGKSFIPMLSSFACAIPGIMATRTIESPKDRLVTILVAPLMSCSARLPVYTLLIAACIPNIAVLGILKLPGLVMLGMYLLGIIVALLMAWLFKKTLLRGETPLLIMELPPYKHPVPRVVIGHMWDRSKLFLRRAGTVILGINILLWFLATYPHLPGGQKQFEQQRDSLERSLRERGEPPATAKAQMVALENQRSGLELRNSFAGRIGRAIEPIIAPLGFDWKMGIGIVSSFAAREVFVSTMSVVYNIGRTEPDQVESKRTLVATLKKEKREDGTPAYTILTGLTLMVFYVLAMQCVSTVAIVRRETNSWKWPVFQWIYMGVLAWLLAFATYRIGLGLGYH
jgi:ferrous iron transport protein B